MRISLSGSSLTKKRRDLWDRLLRAAKQIENELREHLRREFGTTLPRFDVLSALSSASEGLRMSDLSRHLMVSNGNITGIVERLVKDGHVERMASDGDGRATQVVMTGEGRAFFSRLEHSYQARLDELFTDVNYDDADGIILRLARVDGYLKETKNENGNG